MGGAFSQKKLTDGAWGLRRLDMEERITFGLEDRDPDETSGALATLAKFIQLLPRQTAAKGKKVYKSRLPLWQPNMVRRTSAFERCATLIASGAERKVIFILLQTRRIDSKADGPVGNAGVTLLVRYTCCGWLAGRWSLLIRN